MTTPAAPDRAVLEARVRDHLATLDAATLKELDDVLARMAEQPAAEPPPSGDPPVLTRRQALAALGVGGLALVGSNAVTGLVAYAAGDRVGGVLGAASLAASEKARAEALAAQQKASADQLSAATAEANRLRGLLRLYETLEGIGLDSIIGAGLAALRAPLEVVQASINGLRTAVRG